MFRRTFACFRIKIIGYLKLFSVGARTITEAAERLLGQKEVLERLFRHHFLFVNREKITVLFNENVLDKL